MTPRRPNPPEGEQPPVDCGRRAWSARDAQDWFYALESGQVQADQADTLLVRSLLSEQASHVLPDVFECLVTFDVCIAPLSRYNATPARRADGRLLLVLYDGLLDAIVASLELSHAISGMPDALDTVVPRHDCPDISARAWGATLLAEAVRRSCGCGRARPNLWPLVPVDRVRDIRAGLTCAVLWILLHELGHIRLNHLDMGALERLRVPEPEDFLVAEEMTPMHQAELDADREAYESLRPSGHALCFAWMRIALAPQMMFDSLTIRRSGTHPLSVNRLRRILARASESAKPLTIEGTLDAFAEHAMAFASVERWHAQRPDGQAAHGIPRLDDRSLSMLIQGLSPYFDGAGVSLGRVLEAPQRSWRDYAGVKSDG